ncbi:MAG: ATP-binding protein [Tumebacillaceae bacterium]
MKAKKHRRTLRKLITRLIYTSSALNFSVFSLAFFIVSILVLHPLTQGVTSYFSTSIARDMNSQRFLNDLGIQSVEQFDESTPQAKEWMKNIAAGTKISSFLPSMGSSDANAQADLVFVFIEIGDRAIYSNITEEEYRTRKDGFNQIIDFVNTEFTVAIQNKDGVPVGQVTTGMNPSVMLSILIVAVAAYVALVLLSMLVNFILSRLFTIPIIKPIHQLEEKFQAIAEGDFEKTRDTKIVLKKPMREIESLADSTNRIMERMTGYTSRLEEQNSTLEDQFMELEAQHEELAESKRRIQEAQERIEQREKALLNLLNNAGEGFLTFGEDLRIDEEYSLECRQVFEQEIAGMEFPDLLALYDAEQRYFMRNILLRLFQDKDPAKRSLYLPLLTNEIVVGHKHIHIDYKLIQDPFREDSEKFMVILNDITEKRLLQNQVEQERNTLTMVVKVVVQYGDFNECAKEYTHFHQKKIWQILGRDDSLHAKLLDIYRDVHTFKGNFSQLGLIQIVQRLHDLESELTAMIGAVDHLSLHDVRAFFSGRPMGAWLQEDVSVLSDILGDAFFQQDEAILIDKSKLLDIEKKMLALLSPIECKLLLPEVRKLRYKPFKDLLRTYPEYVAGLAERLDKLIEPFEVGGEEFLAATEMYYDFSRSLIHVFRNVVDHGIEEYAERIAAGKDEYGHVSCRIVQEEGGVLIVIADDGKGIDPAEIRTRAVEKGLYESEAAAALSNQEALALIFHDEFSTIEEVTELSGRGMGLSAVKYEVDRLCGTIELHTEVGRGTEFRFRLPYASVTEFPEFHVPTIIEALTETTESFFADYIGVQVSPREEAALQVPEKLHLQQVTSFIAVKGAVEGLFAISMDQQFSTALLRKLLIEELPGELETEYVEDSLAETANIILGNSIRKFKGYEEILIMEPPTTIYTEGASVKYADSEIWTRDLSSDLGTLRLCFILNRGMEG